MIFGKNIFINPGVGVKDFSIHYSRDISIRELRIYIHTYCTYS